MKEKGKDLMYTKSCPRTHVKDYTYTFKTKLVLLSYRASLIIQMSSAATS